MSGNWERRWQPLLQQWVLISARSADRPWTGAMAQAGTRDKPAHDPGCYLCPGVTRANGTHNPDYQGPLAFDNDFPSLSSDEAPRPVDHGHELLQTARAAGGCRVLCWSERHDATLAGLSAGQMRAVVELWRDEYASLAVRDDVSQVLIFENKGTEIGVSNLHPHGQIYATSFVTDTGKRMRRAQADYAARHAGHALLVDLLRLPHTQAHLLVEASSHFSVIVPFAARFAYESWIIPHRMVHSVAELTDAELDDLAGVYQRQAQRYDALFQRESPNITLLHNTPSNRHVDNACWCFHIALQPPLRDAKMLKYLAGFESGSNNIVNPVQPEVAAARLREINLPAP